MERCRPLEALAPAERAALLEELIAGSAAAVLGVDRAAIDPGRPLAALGLDSLSAVELQGAVEAAAGAPPSLDDLLSGASVRELAARLAGTTSESERRHDETGEDAAGEESAVAGQAPGETAGPAAPPTAGQRALWFLERLAPGAGVYNVVVAARARGLDAAALGRALELLAARHPALRTIFPTVADEPVQRVLPAAGDLHARVDFACENATSWNAGRLAERLTEEAWRPFDLARGPLVRARVFARQGDDDEHVLLLAVHHIVADFWSLGILARELGALLDGAGEIAAPPAASTFADFARRQERRLAGPAGERLWSFWRRELAGERGPVPDLDLPTDRPRPPVATWRGLSRAAALPAGLVTAVRGLASSAGATLFAALAAAWQLQLGRYTGQDDFAVGTPTSGRGSPDLADVVGYFVNPVPLRADLAGNPTFRELLARTGRKLVAALGHAELPAPLLVERLRPRRDPARPPLYQVLLTLERRRPGDDPGLAAFALGEEGARIRLGGVVLESIALPERRAQLELSLSAAELPAGGLGLSLEANADLFDPATPERMLGHLGTLLESAVSRPDLPLSELPLLSAAERLQLESEWRATAAPSGATPALPLHELVAERSRAKPDAVALVAEPEVYLTHAGLVAGAGALARRLRQAGVSAERPVALLVERSTDLVVGALGILAAGGVYMPVDPDHAEARLRLLLEDSGAAALVTQRKLASRLPEPGVPVLFVEAGAPAGSNARAEEIGVRAVAPAQLAYLIYTSGSTGRPKGVAVIHAAAVEHCLTWARTYRLSGRDRVLQFPSAGFDAAVEQVFSTLLAGATLVLRGPAPWGPREMARRAAELDVTVADVPTAFFVRWVEDAADLGPAPPALRLIGISGEELRAETARRLGRTPLARLPVLNCYGPTEAVVSATLHEVDPRQDEQAPVPIGRALPGRVARVLARAPGGAGQPQPVGAPGELCLGGVLARGYLGRPDWTAERFVPDPWGAPGARLYRTGDLVRRRPAGALEFLGRLDEQVKVRGFRVEPGEIEAALAAHPAVREAAVAALPVATEPAGELRLVAFVAPILPEDLRAFAASRLPDYMLPAAWLALPALPLNASGKVDRAALSRRAAEARAWDTGRETGESPPSTPPSTPEEELLAGLCAALLGRERVGVDEDFFALGGHSLLATRLVAQVSRLFGVDLPVSAVFAAPRMAALAERIAGASPSEAAPPVYPLPRGASPAGPPLSFAQRRLWFLDRLEPGSAAYNVPGALRLAGPLDVAALAAALAEIVRRHEALRTVYPQVDGEPAQRIEAPPAGPPALSVADLSGLGSAARAGEVARLARAELRRPFELDRGPLLRTALLRLGPTRHLLAATFHHIAVDGWSLGIFLDELSALYPALAGRPAGGHALPILPAPPVQYADFAAWQTAWMQGDVLARQLAYWRGRLAGLPVLELPVDRPRPAVRDARGATRAVFLPEEAAAAVARVARREGATLFMALLAAFQALLARITGAEVVPVGSPVANRRRPEVERLIGLFVNTLVLDARVGDDPSLAALLARVRQACLGAYAHQDLPFELLVEALQPSRGLGQNPLFQVILALEEPLPPRAAGDLLLEPVRGEPGTAKLDLVLTVSPRPEGGWDVLAEYAVALWDPSSIARLLGWFRTLLAGAAADPALRLSELPLLSAPERQQVLAEWNDTAAGSAAGARLHELVAAQAARTPDAVAVAAEGERLTYGALLARARRIAAFLRSLPALLAPEPRVGLCLARRPDLIAGILGILEAGAAYVPLDPAYPQERLELMLADAGAGALLTESALAGRLAFFGGETALLDRLELRASEAPDTAGDERNLAYVIYTSGSTGRPKPVGIEHRSAVTLVRWAHGLFPPADLEGVLAATSVCFDISVFEIFVPLSAGGCVVLAPNITGLPELSDVSAVTLANAVPSPMAELVGSPLPASLRTVNLAGEVLKPDLAARVYAHPQVERVVNLYGPSEDTTYSTVAVVPRGAAQVTIGRPIAGTWARLVGRHGEPLPAGVPGELVLGGEGLARGYLGRPDLTAERFVPDPLAPADERHGSDGARLYRTGDRARLLADGQIEFLGRLDQQVKLHGIRMEMGEIEAYLERHPAVRQALVALRADGAEGPRLVGYVVPEADAAGDDLPAALAAYLRERLPAIMVPAAWVVLAELPLTPNGKVDRRALPAPARLEPAGAVAPRDATEEKLAALWSEVLGRERVGIHDDFFALGGHSLLAVRAAFRIREVFGVELPVAVLFEAPTVAALACHLAAAGERADTGSIARPADLPLAVGDRAPLSSAQRRLWFLHRLGPGSGLHNLQVALRLRGPLDEAALGRALAEILRRHEPLRTVYPDVLDAPDSDPEPWQQILPPASPALARASLAALPAPRRAEALAAALDAGIARPFDLRQGPVARFLLLEHEEDDHVLAAAFHHIAVDGWSLGLFARELADLYGAFARGRPSPLPELPLRYRDLVADERRALAGPAFAEQLGFWRERLLGLPPLALPGDRPAGVSRPRGGAWRLDLPDSLAAALRALGRGEGITPFMVLLGGFAALLARHSGQEDFAVGVPAAGRVRPETQGMIGMFVNPLALRMPLAGDPAFLDLLRRVRDVAVAAQAHQEVPFDRLVEELKPEHRTGLAPLFQVLFTHLSDPAPPLHIPGLSAELLDLEPRAAELDLTLLVHEWEGSLRGWLSFRADRFDGTTARRLLAHLATLLAAVAADPGRRLSEIPLLSAAERAQLLVEWNDTRAAPASPEPAALLHELFEAQARRLPEAVALRFEGEELTYAELDRRAGRLAGVLQARGVGPGSLAGLFLERSAEMVVGILAILKTGGAYVPLDSQAPPARLAFQIADAGVAVLLTHGRLLARLPASRAEILCLDTLGALAAGREGETPPVVSRQPGDGALAYVIYTSGSTGRGKGVAVTHANVRSLFAATASRFQLGPRDVWTLFHSYAFDFSVWEIWGALAHGGTLVVVPLEVSRSPEDFYELLGRERVTVLNQTPSAFRQLIWAEEATCNRRDGVDELALRLVIFGGEALEPASLAPWFARHGDERPRLVNMYGITETTVHVTWRPVGEADLARGSVIGQAIPGWRVVLLDRGFEPVPIGVTGELCVGGAGLALGYLGQPGLTAERFVPDPFGGAAGERLYRSGDLARRLPDGDLEYLGRLDHQVKVRGFRIELGEIETALASHPAVREAVVLARAAADGQRLVAFVVPAAGASPSPGALRAHLRERLPDYMVPGGWVSLPALPLTPNGKVDRRALPALQEVPAEEEFIPPRSPVEEVLAAIWGEVLGRERVGAEDHFFALGGHSLLAVQVVSRVRAAFGVELPLAAVFEAPTPASLARRLSAVRRAGGAAAEPTPPLVREPGAPAPLSFSQQRLWFLDRLAPDEAYHVPGALHLGGPLAEDVLARALGEIVRRHEALRTVFREEGEGSAPVQVVLPPAGPMLPIVDLSALDPGARPGEASRLEGGEARRPFDLAAGPLVRTLLIRLGGDERRLVVVMHHIVSDAWSLGIVLREVGLLYAAFAAGEPSPLPELPFQFPDFARWQRRWLAGEVLERELAHWRDVLAGALESLELPYDRPLVPGAGNRGGRVPFDLPADLYGGLVTLARREGWTAFMVLLAGFGALLSRYSGQEDVVVGSPVANRGRLELEGPVGFFTNTLPLRLDLAGDPAFRALGRRVRRAALDAYAHQDLPFEKLVEELAPDRQAGRNPLFQAMLVLQKAPAPFTLPGLTAELVDVPTATAKFDLTLMLLEDGGGASGWMEHAHRLEEATVARLLVHLRALLAGAVADPAARLSELPLLTPAERSELAAWGRPLAAAPAPWLIHERVVAQAALKPEATAVVFGPAAGAAAAPATMSYGELVARARALARRLRALGVGADVPVGLFLPRSLDAMVAVLGVLEAGGAYLHIDPEYPMERVRLILEDAATPVVLTHARLAAALPEGTAGVLALDQPEEIEPEDPAEDQEEIVGAAPAHLAYVTYTSGSTGRPKGVAMTHAAISAMLDWQLRASRAGGGRTLQFTSLSFDVSFQEIFGTWCAGGTLVLVSEDVRRDPPALCRLLAGERVERLFLPSVALQQVAAAALATAAAGDAEVAFPASLREVASAGEQLHVTPQVTELFSRLPGSALHNHYGPSETHAATWLALDGEPGRWPERPPIGRPVDHARIFLLDRRLRRVPPGLPGEVWVGGAGLARGYLGRPELTAERFLPDPFEDVPGWRPGARMYRTGDLARLIRSPWSSGTAALDPTVAEFLGRADSQVKVRGHRIELPEVEAALARHPAVLQAAVAARGETAGARRLAAYVVLREEVPAPTPGELRAFLAATLPGPMVPAEWARLERLPLTSSGKLDRRALARLDAEERWGEGFVAPRDAAEERLAAIWREVLGVDRVGVHDDFFERGGHSLLATQVASRIRAAFGVELPLRRLFEAPTLAGLAAAVTAASARVAHEAGEAAAAPPRRRQEVDHLPLSFAQERLWFLQRLHPRSVAYNIPLVLRAEGRLEPARLAAALARLAERHEVLRTVFAERDGVPVQRVLPAAAAALPPLPIVVLGALPPVAAEAEASRLAAEEAGRPFDLARGPLLRALLLELPPAPAPGRGAPRWALLLDMHHVISDGWSMGVLIREVQALYAGAVLPELPVQYADFAIWQRRWLAGENLARQLAWWRERLAGAPAALELPADRPRPPVQGERGADWRFALDAGLWQDLAALATREGATPFMVLAAGLFALLGRLADERDLSLGVPIANRTHREVEGLIGFFVNTLVLRIDLAKAASFADLVRQVREASLGAFAHQDVPFEKLVDELQPERDLSRSPLFQVALALQNAPLPEVQLGGVRLTAEELTGDASKFDLAWTFAEAEGRLAGLLRYDADLFAPSTVARWARHFAILLGNLAADPRGRLAEVPLLAEQERHQLLCEWNEAPLAPAAGGARSYVLDAALLPCPVGVWGDLYFSDPGDPGDLEGAGGDLPGVSDAGRPELDAGRFVPDPFAPEPGARLLAAGERARHRADGSLEVRDRTALPASPQEAPPAAYMAPRNDLERAITAVWREVLGVERIGVHESFFTAGGSSLKIAILSARLQRALGREIPVLDLFRHPTIAGLAHSLDAGAPAPPQQIERHAEAARTRTEVRRESLRGVQRRAERRARRVPAGRPDGPSDDGDDG